MGKFTILDPLIQHKLTIIRRKETGSNEFRRIVGEIGSIEMVMPGDNVTFTVKLQKPVALEKGLKFTIREGGHTVGAGVVSDVLD